MKIQTHLTSAVASLALSFVHGFRLEVTSMIILVLETQLYGFPWLYPAIVLHELKKFTDLGVTRFTYYCIVFFEVAENCLFLLM